MTNTITLIMELILVDNGKTVERQWRKAKGSTVERSGQDRLAAETVFLCLKNGIFTFL